MNMKINYSKSIAVWVWLMAWLGIGYVAYQAQQSRIVTDSTTVFTRSIEIEKTMFLPQPIQSFYDPKLSPTPDIQREEKEMWIDQNILYKENPNRSRLDSIFNAELQKSGIAGKGYISYTSEGHTVYGTSEQSEVGKAIPLPPLVYRLSHKKEQAIRLQGYVALPWSSLLWHSSFPLWSLLWLLVTTGGWAGYRYWAKRNPNIRIRKILLPKEVIREEIVVVEEEKIVPVVQKRVLEWVELPHELFFNRVTGVLRYQEESLKLTSEFGKVFMEFMEAEDYCLTYEQLYKIKSGSDSSRENLSFTEKDTLSNTVRQLRKKLEFFPFLTIENLRGIGYRLVIK
jgi:hypothetical protein